jgi:hypothetical protein
MVSRTGPPSVLPPPSLFVCVLLSLLLCCMPRPVLLLLWCVGGFVWPRQRLVGPTADVAELQRREAQGTEQKRNTHTRREGERGCGRDYRRAVTLVRRIRDALAEPERERALPASRHGMKK